VVCCVTPRSLVRATDKILYALIARGQTSLVDYSVREGNHVLLAQQILAKAKQDTVSRECFGSRKQQGRCRGAWD
jgi:hypothetical protein